MHLKIDSSIGMSFFAAVFDAGGMWETIGNRGCSHLMEHLMCKTYEYLYPEMRRLGIKDNAFTSDNRVVFWARGFDEYIDKVSNVILDRLTRQDYLWTEEQFDIEKDIIIQEYTAHFNGQFAGSLSNFMRSKYGYCGPIGIREDIENFTYEKSLAFANEVFKKPKFICTVGNHNIIYDGAFSDKPLLDTLKFGNYNIPLEKIPKEDQTIIVLMHKSPLDLHQTPMIDLISACLGDGLESPLYQEIREKRGLAYGVHVFGTNLGSANVPMVGVETTDKTSSDVVEVIGGMFSQNMSNIISKERFDICLSGILCDKKECEILPHSGVLKTVINDVDPFAGIHNVTYDQMIDYANKHFSMSNFEVLQY